MTISEKAIEIHRSGCNCAQSVVGAYADEKGWDKDMVLKLTSGLGLGFGGSGEICGAVVGACMVLSESIADLPKGERYAIIKKFVKEFEDKCGAVKCPDLKKPKTEDQKRYSCDELVAQAAGMLKEYL